MSRLLPVQMNSAPSAARRNIVTEVSAGTCSNFKPSSTGASSFFFFLLVCPHLYLFVLLIFYFSRISFLLPFCLSICNEYTQVWDYAQVLQQGRFAACVFVCVFITVNKPCSEYARDRLTEDVVHYTLTHTLANCSLKKLSSSFFIKGGK